MEFNKSNLDKDIGQHFGNQCSECVNCVFKMLGVSLEKIAVLRFHFLPVKGFEQRSASMKHVYNIGKATLRTPCMW